MTTSSKVFVFDFLFVSDGRKEIVVDREDITQMEAAASQGDKEDSTQAAMEVKEDKEVTTQVVV